MCLSTRLLLLCSVLYVQGTLHVPGDRSRLEALTGEVPQNAALDLVGRPGPFLPANQHKRESRAVLGKRLRHIGLGAQLLPPECREALRKMGHEMRQRECTGKEQISASLLFSLAAREKKELDPAKFEVIAFCSTPCVRRLVAIARHHVYDSCNLASSWSYLSQMLRVCPLALRNKPAAQPLPPSTAQPSMTLQPSLSPTEALMPKVDIRLVVATDRMDRHHSHEATQAGVDAASVLRHFAHAMQLEATQITKLNGPKFLRTYAHYDEFTIDLAVDGIHETRLVTRARERMKEGDGELTQARIAAVIFSQESLPTDAAGLAIADILVFGFMVCIGLGSCAYNCWRMQHNRHAEHFLRTQQSVMKVKEAPQSGKAA